MDVFTRSSLTRPQPGKRRAARSKPRTKCTADVRGTVSALGIRKLNHTVEKADTPQIRGMINKIVHLLAVEEVK